MIGDITSDRWTDRRTDNGTKSEESRCHAYLFAGPRLQKYCLASGKQPSPCQTLNNSEYDQFRKGMRIAAKEGCNGKNNDGGKKIIFSSESQDRKSTRLN